jgi:hypothetical protein
MILQTAPISQILEMSGIPRGDQVRFLYSALRNPVLSVRYGVLKMGDYPLAIGQFKELRTFRGERVETIPVELQKTFYSCLVTDVQQLVYLAHAEKSDGLMHRPCTAITLENCETTLAWEIAGQSRDPGAVGTLVSGIASQLTFDQKQRVADLADAIARTQPLCRLMQAALWAAGAAGGSAAAGSAGVCDADIICALCMVVGSYTGRYAYAYLPCCDSTAEAIAILSQTCPPSLPRSLGSLSPLLSQHLL